MSTEPAMTRVLDAFEAIATADEEAKRLQREARLHFGRVVNEVTDARELKQEQVAREIGKSREYVRRFQADARDA